MIHICRRISEPGAVTITAQVNSVKSRTRVITTEAVVAITIAVVETQTIITIDMIVEAAEIVTIAMLVKPRSKKFSSPL